MAMKAILPKLLTIWKIFISNLCQRWPYHRLFWLTYIIWFFRWLIYYKSIKLSINIWLWPIIGRQLLWLFTGSSTGSWVLKFSGNDLSPLEGKSVVLVTIRLPRAEQKRVEINGWSRPSHLKSQNSTACIWKAVIAQRDKAKYLDEKLLNDFNELFERGSKLDFILL